MRDDRAPVSDNLDSDLGSLALARSIKDWGRTLGFSDVAICAVMPPGEDPRARETEARLQDWLDRGYHGTMTYMAHHGMRRARPAELVPGTLSVIAVRMDYLPRDDDERADEVRARDPCADGTRADAMADDTRADTRPEYTQSADTRTDDTRTEDTRTEDTRTADTRTEDTRTEDTRTEDTRTDDEDPWRAEGWAALHRPLAANVAHYARGRDYHKVVRARLQKLADRIADAIGPFGHRVFTDSAPVMEVELAQRAGLGWRGKHTLLLSRGGGSMFFLGELFVDLALPADEPVDDHCGTCTRCIDVCPTRAIVAPHVLDARRCISYLTIEHEGPIPDEFRAAVGNRIYGCDDCQLVCPWNRFAQRSPLPDFDVRPHAYGTLVEVFAWSEAEFLRHTEGTSIRRIGHERWLRNVAVALGNALASGRIDHEGRDAIRVSLVARRSTASSLVREHVEWALSQDADAGRRRLVTEDRGPGHEVSVPP